MSGQLVHDCLDVPLLPRAHVAPVGATFTCGCGRSWRVVQHDLVDVTGLVCLCGWTTD
jgi:hypothetical protein